MAPRNTSSKAKGKSRIRRFFGNWIVKNLLIAVGIIAVVMISAGIFLSTYTRHGEKILLPDFFGMSVAEASRIADEIGVELVVTDSVYNKRLAPGTIFSQMPKDSSYVKKGRHISIIINSIVPRKVKMPNLVDISLRQAMANLSSKGLQLGRLNYRYSGEGSNLVLEQRYRGRIVAPGQLVESGATIDLVLSLKDSDRTTYVPDVRGKRYGEAVNALHDNSLNVTARFDRSIRTYEDSLKAIVGRQGPEPSRNPIARGASVTIYMEPAAVVPAAE